MTSIHALIKCVDSDQTIQHFIVVNISINTIDTYMCYLSLRSQCAAYRNRICAFCHCSAIRNAHAESICFVLYRLTAGSILNAHVQMFIEKCSSEWKWKWKSDNLWCNRSSIQFDYEIETNEKPTIISFNLELFFFFRIPFIIW